MDTESTADVKQLPGAFGLFGPSIDALKLNFWTFVWAIIIPIALVILPVLIAIFGIWTRTADYTNTHTTTYPILFNVVAITVGVLGVFAVSLFFTTIMYVIKFQSAKGKKIGIKAAMRHGKGYYWRMFRLYLLRNLIIFVGFLLLIVPGFFFWKRYMLAPFYLLDKNMGIRESLRQSAADSGPFSSAIWGMIGIYTLLAVVQVVPFIGYLAIIPSILYCCAQALRYLQIQAAKRS